MSLKKSTEGKRLYEVEGVNIAAIPGKKGFKTLKGFQEIVTFREKKTF